MTQATKKCTLCKEHKLLIEFQPRKIAKDGKHSQCRLCRYSTTKKYKRSKIGCVTVLFNNQVNHSKTRGHRKPDYTKQELIDWIFSQEKFHVVYNEWVNSGFEKRLAPSVDRLNDDIHYCFGNIQLTVWHLNNLKDNAGRFRNGFDKRRNGK